MRFVPRMQKVMIWLVGFAVSSSSFIGCHCDKDKPDVKQPENPKPYSVNLVLSAAISDADIKSAFINAVNALSPDDIVLRRCSCDEKLLNITLPGSYTITGQGPLAVRPPGGGASGDVTLPLQQGSLGFNYSINTFEPRVTEPNSLSPTSYISEKDKDPAKAVPVAVFDTGLQESSLPKLNQKYPLQNCANDTPTPGDISETGWNFVGASGDVRATGDNHVGKHGTLVSYLVARQSNGTPTIVKIVPMKVLGSNNTGDMFGLLCAMETARKNKIPIFNMSLGYYGPPDELLRQYVKKATEAGIWIVAAAGNKPQGESPDSTRNLDKMQNRFYPASFSEFDRVLAVTTANLETSELKACDGQNYSSNLVLGAVTNSPAGPGNLCRFPLQGFTPDVFGSSFATPVLAGWLATQLNRPGGLPNRSAVIGAMLQATTGSQLHQNRYIKAVQ